MLAETMATVPSLYPNVTNAELAASFGADLLLFNLFDVFQPSITGLEVVESIDVVQQIKTWTGRPVGVNLEPVDPDAKQTESLDTLAKGRTAADESLRTAQALGFDYVCLTGNPKTGVTNEKMVEAIKRASCFWPRRYDYRRKNARRRRSQ